MATAQNALFSTYRRIGLIVGVRRMTNLYLPMWRINDGVLA